jgi:hypothetical protein
MRARPGASLHAPTSKAQQFFLQFEKLKMILVSFSPGVGEVVGVSAQLPSMPGRGRASAWDPQAEAHSFWPARSLREPNATAKSRHHVGSTALPMPRTESRRIIAETSPEADRFGMPAPLGLAAGAKATELAGADPVQNRFGDDGARRIAGSGPLILAFAKVAAEKGCECSNWTTSAPGDRAPPRQR